MCSGVDAGAIQSHRSLSQRHVCNPVVYFTPLKTSPVDRPAKLALHKRAAFCPEAL